VTARAFDPKVLNAEMGSSSETTRWAFGQIYRFAEPDIRAYFVE